MKQFNQTQPPDDQLKALLIGQREFIRFALRQILAQSPKYALSEAFDLDQGVAIARATNPALMIVDLENDGLPLSRSLISFRSERSTTSLVAMIHSARYPVVKDLVDLGFNGFIESRMTIAQILQSLASILQGNNNLQDLLPPANLEQTGDPLSMLSKREREVFYLICRGEPNRVIAKQLLVSPRTIETHRARILRKLDVNNPIDLTRFALRMGLIPL